MLLLLVHIRLSESFCHLKAMVNSQLKFCLVHAHLQAKVLVVGRGFALQFFYLITVLQEQNFINCLIEQHCQKRFCLFSSGLNPFAVYQFICGSLGHTRYVRHFLFASLNAKDEYCLDSFCATYFFICSREQGLFLLKENHNQAFVKNGGVRPCPERLELPLKEQVVHVLICVKTQR